MSSPEQLQHDGIKLFEQHDYEAAARAFQDARDAFMQDDNHDMAAEMSVNIGLVHRALGESQQALEMMQEALRHFQSQDDKLRTAQVLGNLGGVYMALNDKEHAELSYRQASNLFKEIGEDTLYSETLMALGAMQFRDGKVMAGAATYGVALENRDDLTAPQRIIKMLSNVINRLSGTPTA